MTSPKKAHLFFPLNLALFLSSLTITLSPLYILRDKFFFIPTTLLEALIILSILATANLFLSEARKEHRSHPKEGAFSSFFLSKDSLRVLRTNFDLLILIFLVCATVATFISFDFIGGLGILKAYFIEPILFFYSLVYLAKKANINFILFSLILSATWLSVLALIQKITGGFTFAPNELSLDRVSAVYNSANSLALYLGPIALLTLSVFIYTKNRFKLGYLFLFVFLTSIIILTRSRGGLISELIAILILFYALVSFKVNLLRRIWFIVPILVLIATSTFLFYIYQTYNFIPELRGQPYTQGDTLQIRYFIWVGTTNLLKDNPITGAGLNGFKTLYSNQYRLPQFREEFQYPHNLILTFWTETGIFGLFSFLMIFIGSLGLIIRKLTTEPKPILGIGLLAALSYIFIHGIVVVPSFKNDLSLQFWTIIALIEIWANFKENI